MAISSDAAMADGAVRHQGACHCGAIGYSYYTKIEPTGWSVRACQCSFCRAHGALSTSDPSGLVEFHLREGARLLRYRFGQRTADFLICGECGVYIAAVIDTPQGWFSVVNINVLQPRPAALGSGQPVSYEAESSQQRIQRRAERWTPCNPP